MAMGVAMKYGDSTVYTQSSPQEGSGTENSEQNPEHL